MDTDSKSKSWFGWLKSVDLFGTPIRLHIFQQPEYKSRFSGFISLCVIVGFIISAITMVVTALFYANVNFLTSKTATASQSLSLDPSNFMMAVKIQDPNFLASNSYYSIEFQYVITDSHGSIQYESIGTTTCTDEYLGSVKNSSNIFCPKITSYSVETKSKYIQVSISKCQSSANSDIVCASQSEIDSYFAITENIQSYPITIYMTDHYFDMLQDTPNTNYIKHLDFYLPGGDLGRKIRYSLREELVKVEWSFFDYFKKGIHLKDTFSIEENPSDQLLMSNNQGSFLDIQIKKSQFDQKYVRSFTKLGDILAFLGGLAKALMIIAGLITIPYNQFYYNLAISNEIYEFESRPKVFYQKTMQNNKFRKASKTFRDIDHFTTTKESQAEIIEGTKSNPNRHMIHKEKMSEYHPFFESLLLRHHRLTFTISESFKNFIYCCRRRNLHIKQDLYDQAKKRLRADIDIITVLKKLQDVDKLKNLLLNNSQIELFNYKRPLRIEYLGQLKAIDQAFAINKRGSNRPNDDENPSQRSYRTNNIVNQNKYDYMLRNSLYLHDRPLDTVEQFQSLFDAYKVVSREKASVISKKIKEMLGANLIKIFEKLEEDYKIKVALLTPTCPISPLLPRRNRRERTQHDHYKESFSENMLNDDHRTHSNKYIDTYSILRATIVDPVRLDRVAHLQHSDVDVETNQSNLETIQVQTLSPKFLLQKENDPPQSA